jgi:hypothetical protein
MPRASVAADLRNHPLLSGARAGRLRCERRGVISEKVSAPRNRWHRINAASESSRMSAVESAVCCAD